MFGKTMVKFPATSTKGFAVDWLPIKDKQSKADSVPILPKAGPESESGIIAHIKNVAHEPADGNPLPGGKVTISLEQAGEQRQYAFANPTTLIDVVSRQTRLHAMTADFEELGRLADAMQSNSKKTVAATGDGVQEDSKKRFEELKAKVKQQVDTWVPHVRDVNYATWTAESLVQECAKKQLDPPCSAGDGVEKLARRLEDFDMSRGELTQGSIGNKGRAIYRVEKTAGFEVAGLFSRSISFAGHGCKYKGRHWAPVDPTASAKALQEQATTASKKSMTSDQWEASKGGVYKAVGDMKSKPTPSTDEASCTYRVSDTANGLGPKANHNDVMDELSSAQAMAKCMGASQVKAVKLHKAHLKSPSDFLTASAAYMSQSMEGMMDNMAQLTGQKPAQVSLIGDGEEANLGDNLLWAVSGYTGQEWSEKLDNTADLTSAVTKVATELAVEIATEPIAAGIVAGVSAATAGVGTIPTIVIVYGGKYVLATMIGDAVSSAVYNSQAEMCAAAQLVREEPDGKKVCIRMSRDPNWKKPASKESKDGKLWEGHCLDYVNKVKRKKVWIEEVDDDVTFRYDEDPNVV